MAEKTNERPAASGAPSDNTKGKQRTTDNDASLTDRIQQSATMALNSFARPAAPDSMVNGFSDSKGSQASASSQHGHLEPTLADVPSHRIHQSAHLGAEAFRSAPSSSNDAEFTSFQGQPEMLPLNNAQLPVQSSQSEVGYGDFAQQKASDGAAVLGLLDENPSDSGILSIYLHSGEKLFITPYEKDRLAQALFGGRQGSKLETLISPAEDEREANVWGDEDWKEVFASYTDDVWGDLGPLAVAAKKEVEDPRKNSQTSPALTQLRGALRQLRARL